MKRKGAFLFGQKSAPRSPRRARSRFRSGLLAAFLTLLAALMLIPIWMLLTGAFLGPVELGDNFGPALSGAPGWAIWPPVPRFPTLRPFAELLLETPRFYQMFWNSCLQVIPALLGQLVVGAPAAWAFARFRFRGKGPLFLLYIVLMLLPFQVTMVSNYLVLNRLNLMNTHFAVLLPAVFSTFPVFMLVKFFAAIPGDVLDAARLDAAGDFAVFWNIGLPMGAPGLLAATILGFLEGWNAIEQPMIFLMQNRRLWPLSLYLPEIADQDAGASLAAAVVMLLPALLIFWFGQDYLEQGIGAAALKG